MKDYLAVFLGGGVGASVRYAMYTLAPSPWMIVVVNVLGCVGIGFASHPALGLSHGWRLLLVVGFLGGFTTFSTLVADLLRAIGAGDYGLAAALTAASLGFGLGGGTIGWWIAGLLRIDGGGAVQ